MGYAGDVSCLDCFAELESSSGSQLIDVRSMAEWAFVGIPDLSKLNKRPILQEWQSYPTMSVNPSFVDSVAKELNDAGATRDDAIYLLCRSGVRSKAAASALTEAGYSRAYNVTDGFEGGLDATFHRGNTGGWKHEGLPWKQQ